MLYTVLLVILILILLGGVGGPYIGARWPVGYGAGYGGMGIVGILLVVLLVMMIIGLVPVWRY
jgi:hypothetical protein